MKLIKQKYEIIEQEPGLDGIYKAIENAGRTCYKSIGTRYFKIPINGVMVPDVWHYLKLDTTCKKFLKTESKNLEVPNKTHIINGCVSIADKDVKNFEGLEKYESEFNPKFHKNVTAEDFVNRMIKSGHSSMLEFGTVYAFYPLDCDKHDYQNLIKVHDNPYTKVFIRNEHNNTKENGYYITTNYRTILENDVSWGDDVMKHLCEPTEYHEKRVCVRFTTSIGISRELNRHRVDSISEQSTRYCNFSKDKFGNELTFIIPSDSKLNEGTYECFEDSDSIEGFSATCLETDEELSVDNTSLLDLHFLKSCDNTQYEYLELIKCGAKPQQARNVLTLGLATEVNHCAFISDWKHFFSLRSSHAGAEGMHPGMNYIANQVYDDFLKRKFLNK